MSGKKKTDKPKIYLDDLVQARILRLKELTPAAKLLFFYLYNTYKYHIIQISCIDLEWPSLRTMSEDLSLSYNTVDNSLKLLENFGIVKVQRGRYIPETKRYDINQYSFPDHKIYHWNEKDIQEKGLELF
jgi:DNA-binding MarR family transcriptional regulator